MRYIPLLLLLAACHKTPAPPAKTAYPVQLCQAVSKDVPIYLETLGHVDPITSISVRSRIEGELVGVHFAQGQEVRRNDLLFSIDPKPYQAALKEAEGALEQNLAALALAQEKVKRYKLLAQEEYFSQLDYETLQAQLAESTALVAQSKAQVETAKINLDYCRIYAPIDGLMGILQVDLGNLVANNGNPMVSLNQIAPIYVSFSLPEFQLHKVQKQAKGGKLKVEAAFESFAESFEGVLSIIDNMVSPDTGMVTMRAVFANEARDLWPGQFIRVRLILQTLNNAVVIPYTAVQRTLSGPVVFVVQPDNTVQPRPVKLGQRQDEEVIIAEGLQAGETIVLEGQLNLYAGAKIMVPS